MLTSGTPLPVGIWVDLMLSFVEMSWRDLICLYKVSANAKEREGGQVLGHVTVDGRLHGSRDTV